MAYRAFRKGAAAIRTARETMWIFLQLTENAIAGGQAAVLSHSLNAAAKALRPFTVIRTRGIYYLRSDQISAQETFAASIGLSVVSDQASAIGVTAVPTPETDRGSDLFLMYESLHGEMAFTTGTGFRDVGTIIQFDSKAMRKVNDDQDLVMTQETTAYSAGVITAVGARILLKLH